MNMLGKQYWGKGKVWGWEGSGDGESSGKDLGKGKGLREWEVFLSVRLGFYYLSCCFVTRHCVCACCFFFHGFDERARGSSGC